MQYLSFAFYFYFCQSKMSLLVAMQAACTSYGLGLVSCTFLWREALDLSAEAAFLSAKLLQCAKDVRESSIFRFL